MSYTSLKALENKRTALQGYTDNKTLWNPESRLNCDKGG